MARIELSNIGGGGTTLSLTTTGTSGAATLAGSVLNIPVYQGQLTLTTTGTSGAATLVGNTLNVPQYSGGGTPAGAAGQVQFNSTPAGSFAASANLAWDNTAVQLNINTPLSPTGKLNVKGSGATSSTVNTRLTDSGNTELVKVLDNGSTNIGANFNWDNVNGRLGLGTSTPNQTLEVSGAMRLTGTAGTAAFMLGRNSAGDVSTVTLGTTGTSGAATLSANVLNIPQYQGALTLTTTGTSGAATLAGNILNVPQYATASAGSTGEIQYNNAGAFGASANLAWDNTATQLNIGAPLSPTGRLNVKGTGTLATVNTRLTNSGDTELLKVLDNGSTNIGSNFAWDNTNNRLNIGNLPSPAATVNIKGAGNTLASGNAANIANSDSKSILRTRNDGVVLFGNTSSILWFPIADAGGGATNIDGTNFSLYSSTTNQAASWGRLHIGGEVHTQTSGDVVHMYLFDRFSPTSGTATTSTLRMNTQINQTGGANGITRGIYLTPLLTSAADWRSIEWNNNSGFGLYGVGTANNYLAGNTAIGTITPSSRLHVRGSNASSGTNALLVQNSTPSDIYKIENDGKVSYWATNTAAGTTGAQTIDRPSGTVNFAAAATSLVVTNSLCTTSSIVFATVRTNDATAQIKNVVPAAGSFTINLSAAATAETSVGFFIIN